jgi:hypothetical protein
LSTKSGICEVESRSGPPFRRRDAGHPAPRGPWTGSPRLGVWTFSPAFSRVRAGCPGLIAERCLEGSRVASAHGWRAPNQYCVAERRLLHPARSRNPTASITLWPVPSPVSTTTLSSAPKAASPGRGWTRRRIDKASRGVQASLARRDGYGPLIPWAEATRLPSNHRFAVPQDVQTPDRGLEVHG